MADSNNLTMKQLPVSERPYEKCEKYGPSALSDAELLAIILKSGKKGKKALDTAYELLKMDEAHPGLEGLLLADYHKLRRIEGIGYVKALNLLSVCELSRRLSRVQFHENYVFSSPQSVAEYYMPQMRCKLQEELHAMMLDSKNRLICERMLTLGTVDSSLIDPRGIYLEALHCGAVGVILVHNHPSGDPAPSREDLAATVRVSEAGKILGIPLIDHIIIGNTSFTSLRESGCITGAGRMQSG